MRLEETDRQAAMKSFVDQAPPAQLNQRAIDDYFREHMPFIGPVPLGTALTMTGDVGLMARLQVGRGSEAASYTVRIRNEGSSAPIDGSFSVGGAWLDTD